MNSKFVHNKHLTLGLVADILSVSKETVRKWERNGKLRSSTKNDDGVPLYRWSDLHQFSVVQKMIHSNWEQENKIKPLRTYSSLELFAGAGGLALGLERAGFDAVALNEFDKDACDTLLKNRPYWNVIREDISKVDFRGFDGIDFISGGFPCQAFSYAGNRYGFEDTRGTLFFEFARVVKVVFIWKVERQVSDGVFLGMSPR